jgi:opacity protein-like surface antigen
MKRFLLAITLACALAVSAMAGDIHTVGAPAPGDMGDPPAPGDMNEPPAPGDMGSGCLALIILDLLF